MASRDLPQDAGTADAHGDRSLPEGTSAAAWATVKLSEVCDHRLAPADVRRCRILALAPERNVYIVDTQWTLRTFSLLATFTSPR